MCAAPGHVSWNPVTCQGARYYPNVRTRRWRLGEGKPFARAPEAPECWSPGWSTGLAELKALALCGLSTNQPCVPCDLYLVSKLNYMVSKTKKQTNKKNPKKPQKTKTKKTPENQKTLPALRTPVPQHWGSGRLRRYIMPLAPPSGRLLLGRQESANAP